MEKRAKKAIFRYVNNETEIVVILYETTELLVRQFEFGSGWDECGPLLLDLVAWCLSKNEDRQGILGAIGLSKILDPFLCSLEHWSYEN